MIEYKVSKIKCWIAFWFIASPSFWLVYALGYFAMDGATRKFAKMQIRMAKSMLDDRLSKSE